MLIVTLVPSKRLLSRIGFDGPEDYLEFLKFAEKEEEKHVNENWKILNEIKLNSNNLQFRKGCFWKRSDDNSIAKRYR